MSAVGLWFLIVALRALGYRCLLLERFTLWFWLWLMLFLKGKSVVRMAHLVSALRADFVER